MNIVFVGECQKHDFVLTVAVLIGVYHEKPVSIVTDDDRHYRYFKGEVSGVQIVNTPQESKGIVIYDWHSLSLPVQDDHDKSFVITTYEKHSVEAAASFARAMHPKGVILIESDCNISSEYIEAHLPEPLPIYEYGDSPRRRIDWIYDQHVNFRGLEKDFMNAVGHFVSEMADIPKQDLKNLWKYVKKRG